MQIFKDKIIEVLEGMTIKTNKGHVPSLHSAKGQYNEAIKDCVKKIKEEHKQRVCPKNT